MAMPWARGIVGGGGRGHCVDALACPSVKVCVSLCVGVSVCVCGGESMTELKDFMMHAGVQGRKEVPGTRPVIFYTCM